LLVLVARRGYRMIQAVMTAAGRWYCG
jgi:hypothetical protein